MNKLPIVLALLTAVSMAFGQLCFKLGAPRWRGDTVPALITSFLSNPLLMGAIGLYAITILIWIYVLKSLPLSIAYPLTAISYVLVPLLSWLLLNEKLTINTLIGGALIVAGVLISHLQRS